VKPGGEKSIQRCFEFVELLNVRDVASANDLDQLVSIGCGGMALR